MKQFLATKAAVIYAQNKVFTTNETAPTPADLADGALGIYAVGSNDKLSLVTAASGLADVREFVIARGTPTGVAPMVTDAIERNEHFCFEKAAYNAGSAKVITFGGPSSALTGGNTTIIAGSIAEVEVVDHSPRLQQDFKVKTYAYSTKVANENTATIAAGLVAAINADPNATVVASTTGATTGGTLILTAKVIGKPFEARMMEDSITVASSKTVTTTPVNAFGTFAQMRELEVECEGYQGRTNYVDRTVGPTVNLTQTEAGVNYGVYYISWVGIIRRLGVATDQVAERYKRLYLAVPSGATGATTLDALLLVVAKSQLATAEIEDGTGA